MTSIRPPMCWGCKRYRFEPGVGREHCEAYPDGIPETIMQSGVDHREPYEGDHGLQFVPVSAEVAELVDEYFEMRRAERASREG